MTGRVTCKDCGKCWQNYGAYCQDSGCDRGWCAHQKGDEEVGKRSKKNRKNLIHPHIHINPPEDKVFGIIKEGMMSRVLSDAVAVKMSQEDQDSVVTMMVPDSIVETIKPVWKDNYGEA